MKRRALTGFLLLFLYACIEPYNLTQVGYPELLMVDGLISDQPGPYIVRLFKAKALDATSQLEQLDGVKGAAIVLFDDQGNQEALSEVSTGIYQTAAGGMQGVAGASYHIRITTSDDKIYESTPEKIIPVGDLQNLYFEFNQTEEPPQVIPNPIAGLQVGCKEAPKATAVVKNGFAVYLDGTILPEQNGLVRWRWTGTYHVKTYPELKMKIKKPPQIGCLPSPTRCSGWVIDGENENNTFRFGPCSCCDCWVTQYNDQPLLSEEKRFAKFGDFTRYQIAFLPATRRLFYEKYRIEVEQMSLSLQAYTFWSYVKVQQRQSSDLFQTPPPVLVGNVQAVSDGAMPVLGMFSASSISTKAIFIDRSDIPYPMPLIDTVAENCNNPIFFKNSSTAKPDFW